MTELLVHGVGGESAEDTLHEPHPMLFLAGPIFFFALLVPGLRRLGRRLRAWAHAEPAPLAGAVLEPGGSA